MLENSPISFNGCFSSRPVQSTIHIIFDIRLHHAFLVFCGYGIVKKDENKKEKRKTKRKERNPQSVEICRVHLNWVGVVISQSKQKKLQNLKWHFI